MIAKRREVREEHHGLSQGFKRQLKQIRSLSQLRQQLSRELGRNNHDNQDDVSILLRSLATILSMESEREQLREDYLTEFNQLFEQIINKKAEQKQISEWYKRNFAKMSIQGRKLRQALAQAHNLNVKLINSEFEVGLANEKYAQKQSIVHNIDQQIRELETLIERGHGETHHYNNKEKLPHLFKVADFIERNTLTQTESEIVHEVAQKSMWLMGSEQFQYYEIQAHCKAIEQLTRRFTKSPNQLIDNICALLKVQMHLVELLSKKQTGSRNVAELEAINNQVIEKLMAMKMETQHLVKNLSLQGQQALSLDQHGQLLDMLSDDAQSGNISGDIESHYELNKKKIQEYESKFMNLNNKIVQRTSEVESLRRSREQSRYREESHSNRIQFLESENASLKANLEMIRPAHQNNIIQEREIERLQLELANINSHLDILTQNETRDQAEIGRLRMLITDYEQQQNTSRRQLQELIARVNFRYNEKRQTRGTISDKNDLSEEFMRIRLRQLEQEVEVYISVNEVYVENQRNIEVKLEELQKQNSKLTKKKNKLEQQLKEYNLMSHSVSRDTYFLLNNEDYHSMQQTPNSDWKNRQKQLNDKILRLTFSLETIKSEYLEQVRRRGATTQKLEKISKQQGGFIDDRVELFTEKRVLEDDNHNLLQSLDRAQVQISQMEKKQRKLLKSEKEKIKLIEHLQRENLQLSNPREHEVFDTQRTTELTGRQKGEPNHQQLLKELQQFRSKIKLLQQQKDFYVKAIEDQVISSKTVEYESRLEECASRNQQLEKAIAIKDQQIRILISQQPDGLAHELQSNSLIHQGTYHSEAEYDEQRSQNIIPMNNIKKPQVQIRQLQQCLDKVHNQYNMVLQENQRLNKQVERLESQLSNLQLKQTSKEDQIRVRGLPLVSRLSLKQNSPDFHEQSLQSHAINDITLMKQRLIDLIGWSRLKPLFADYVRLKRSETLIQIQLLLNS